MIGVRIGGYTITEQLGEGGMGAVYVAENPRLGKRVAVKVLLPQFCQSPHIVERFEAEARAATAIRHPNIIDVLDVAQLDDGQLYILMEYLEGCALETFIRNRGALSIDEALVILAPACDALQAAHDAGIIHRDLKPANIFLVLQPENPRFVKLLDFGIAKITREDLAGGVKTGSNMVLGTPGYMSYEQACGSAGVDHRSDVYAMGVIAFQMLTGRLPYAATSIGSLVTQQLTSTPPNPASLRPDLPQGWVAAILATLQTEPNKRPQSARAFATALIDATPNGEALVRSVCPRFFLRANADERTVRDVIAPSPPPSGGATVALKPQSTVSHTAGQQQPSVSTARGRRWPFAVAGVAMLAAAAIVAIVIHTRSASDQSDQATALAAPPDFDAGLTRPVQVAPSTMVSVDAAPPTPAPAVLHVDTHPPGAMVRRGAAVDGPSPIDLQVPRGTEIDVSVELKGYEPESRRVTVNSGHVALDLTLTPIPVHHPHHRTHRPQKHDATPTAPGSKALPTDTRPKHFDPDAPAG